MKLNKVINEVKEIENIELELTKFNAKRALSNVEKNLEINRVGNCTLLMDNNSPNSIYYNRVKGFSSSDIDYLDSILNMYSSQNISPCFDLTPDQINPQVGNALLSKGFSILEQLVFMQMIPEQMNVTQDIKIVEVTAEQAELFVKIIIDTNHLELDNQIIQDKKNYFYKPYFKNYIAYIGEEIAGIGSLYIHKNTGYIANDYTLEKFRGMGVQKALLAHRINESVELNLEKIYTDVEFGSISHNNMETLGFKTVFLNSFWVKS